MSTLYSEDVSAKDEDSQNNMWQFVLEFVTGKANYLEFNELDQSKAFTDFLSRFSEEYQGCVAVKKKLYEAGAVHRFQLSARLLDYLKEIPFCKWYNFDLEDPSFYNDDVEIVATISHESYMMMYLDDSDLEQFRQNGFKLDCIVKNC